MAYIQELAIIYSSAFSITSAHTAAPAAIGKDPDELARDLDFNCIWIALETCSMSPQSIKIMGFTMRVTVKPTF
jgi:hypothetical protein